jgi:hypothetical protein
LDFEFGGLLGVRDLPKAAANHPEGTVLNISGNELALGRIKKGEEQCGFHHHQPKRR